ncbi:uncharacterized protein LOC142975246 [Anticarsia gemmatalis]|uniref:uncharacterized protein LOC142975246 n=1 Tax=Anticarsia gemmatalis TaxID=129554 RepID=UPI003F7645DE
MCVVDVVYSGFVYHENIKGWIKPFKLVTTWDKAAERCYSAGAIMASPIDKPMLSAMKSIILDQRDQSQYFFIGMNSKFAPEQFVSQEGIKLEDLPETAMITRLESLHGRCLSMNLTNIRVEPCSHRLAYMCYKRKQHLEENREPNECGTYDDEYKLNETTGSCYKYHMELKTWDEANIICAREGAYLAIINDEEEAKLHTAKIVDKQYDLYVGLRDLELDNNWMSIHGQPVEQLYNSWWQGAKRVVPPRHCGYLDTYTGQLDDSDCSSKLSFVCEKNPAVVRFPPRQTNMPQVEFAQETFTPSTTYALSQSLGLHVPGELL